MRNSFKRYRLACIILALVLLGSTVLGCGPEGAGKGAAAGESKDSSPGAQTQRVLQAKGLTEEEKVEKLLQSMTLTEKLGQLMIVGIHGTAVNEDSLYQLHQFHFGGIILFDRNMESLEQVRKLNADLQKQCDEKLPLFIALDEEGGDVVRMEDALKPPPSQKEIGQSGRPELAKESAVEVAKRMQAIGFNVNFAPVADIGDLGSRGSRYFSQDPAEAARFVEAAARGYEQQGMYYSLKHFPGIGKGETDPHLDRVVINAAKEELLAEDVLPFKGIIDNHDGANYFVMVSHNTYPELAGDVPATLSPEIMTGLLRKELGFKGVILTDDMEMGAVANYNGFRNMGVLAVEAGADVVLVCHDYEHETDTYMGLLEAVRAGRLSEERINESVRRVIRMKLQYLVK